MLAQKRELSGAAKQYDFIFCSFIGPCKGGVRGFWIQISNGTPIVDSIFKITRFNSGFKFLLSQDSGFRFFILLGFKFQTTFLRFIIQTSGDSGFKFEIGGIQDSDLGLQGPFYARTSCRCHLGPLHFRSRGARIEKNCWPIILLESLYITDRNQEIFHNCKFWLSFLCFFSPASPVHVFFWDPALHRAFFRYPHPLMFYFFHKPTLHIFYFFLYFSPPPQDLKWNGP